jgi:hypothetical protein
MAAIRPWVQLKVVDEKYEALKAMPPTHYLLLGCERQDFV